MKTKFILGLMAICAGAALASCSNDDDDIDPSDVPSSVKTEFSQMFPGATGLEWEKYGPYYVASFYQSVNECDAWFESDGDWLMTETDYDDSVASLPLLMQSAFGETAYANWFVDDVTLYVKPAESFCQIEVEAPGQPDTSIFIDNAGMVMNIVPNYAGVIAPVTNITLL